MNKLTNFQKKCEHSLIQSLCLLNMELCDRNLDGDNEIFIYAKICNKQIELWIYENEAMFSGKDFEFHFENPDYHDKDKLIDDFVKTINLCLNGKVPKSAGSGFFKIFNGRKL